LGGDKQFSLLYRLLFLIYLQKGSYRCGESDTLQTRYTIRLFDIPRSSSLRLIYPLRNSYSKLKEPVLLKNGSPTYVHMSCFGKGKLLICQTLGLQQKVLLNRHHQHASGFDWLCICFLEDVRSTKSLIPLRVNYALLLVAFSRTLYAAATQEKHKKLTRSFNFTFRHKDFVLSLNNSKFGDYVDHIYPVAIDTCFIHWHTSKR
jgi:hypothetical protein